MKYLPTLLLTTATGLLLTGSTACSKKDDPAATDTSVGTASYKLDGSTISGQSRAYTTNMIAGSQVTNILYINISDTPQLQSNTQTVLLTFQKQPGQPNTAYQLYTIAYSKDGTLQPINYANNVTTLKETSSGVFSGTFSGTSTSPTGHTISEGVFTDAHLTK